MKSHIVFVCWILISGCYTQTMQQAKDLRTYLFVNQTYDYTIRPVSNMSEPVYVYALVFLLNIIDLDVAKEVLYTTALLYLGWHDPGMSWNSSDFGGLKRAHFPQSELWKPDITLKNTQSKLDVFGSPRQNVNVRHDGSVRWPSSLFLDATCPINVRYYPFDIQTCPLKFVSFTYAPDEIRLSSYESGINLDEYETNPVWTILSTSYKLDPTEDNVEITFMLRMQRKSLYVCVNVLFPVAMLVVLNLCVFLVPCDSGEKSGYAITIFLSFAVFLTLIDSSMPTNSDSIALLSVFVVSMTTMSTIITILTQIMIRCSKFNSEKTKIPPWLIFLSNLGKCQLCRTTKSRREAKTTEVEEIKEKVPNASQNDIREAFEDETESVTVYTWNQVMNDLDRFLFIAFGSVALIISITYFSACAASW